MHLPIFGRRGTAVAKAIGYLADKWRPLWSIDLSIGPRSGLLSLPAPVIHCCAHVADFTLSIDYGWRRGAYYHADTCRRFSPRSGRAPARCGNYFHKGWTCVPSHPLYANRVGRVPRRQCDHSGACCRPPTLLFRRPALSGTRPAAPIPARAPRARSDAPMRCHSDDKFLTRLSVPGLGRGGGGGGTLGARSHLCRKLATLRK